MNIDITEIPKLFSVIFFECRNSSQANFGIIPNYRNSTKPISVLYQITVIQSKPFSVYPKLATLYAKTFGKSSHAHTRTNKHLYSIIQLHYTLYEYALQLTAHSVCFLRLSPNRSDTVKRRCLQAWKTVIYILVQNLFAKRCVL